MTHARHWFVSVSLAVLTWNTSDSRAASADSYLVQRVPSRFKFQARISQARLPEGKGTFASLKAEIRDAADRTVCSQVFTNARVRDSYLNLDIDGLSCSDERQNAIAPDEAIAKYPGLYLVICFGSSCLEGVPLESVPYAVKSSYASQVDTALVAEWANGVSYAHRVSADANMLTPQSIGLGYFDFQTPDQSSIYPDFRATHSTDGFIAWAPTEQENPRVNVCAQDPLGALLALDAFTILATDTSARGALLVGGTTTMPHAAVARAGVTVEAGDLQIVMGDLAVATGAVTVASGAAVAVTVDATGVSAKLPNGVITGKSATAPDVFASHQLLVGEHGTIQACGADPIEMLVALPVTFTGDVSTQAETKLSKLLIGQTATIDAVPTGMHVTAPASFSNRSILTGDVLIGEDALQHEPGLPEMVVSTSVRFEGPVTFAEPASLDGTLVPSDGTVTTDSIANATVAATDLSAAVRASWFGAWTRRHASDSSVVRYRNGTWWIFGRYGVLKSTDGINFEFFRSPYAFYDVEHDGGRWLGLVEGYSVVTCNDNLICQTNGILPNMRDVDYDASRNLWVAVGGGTARSTNGTTWQDRTVTDALLFDVAHFGPYFYAVGENDGAMGGRVLRSSDGAQWFTMATTTDVLRGIARGAGLWVAVGERGIILTSADGASWLPASSVPTTRDLRTVTYDTASGWIAAGERVVVHSADGNVWTEDPGASMMTVDVDCNGTGTCLVAGFDGVFGKATAQASLCRNGRLDPGEECDDNNTVTIADDLVGGTTCDAYVGAGSQGSVGCSSICKLDSSRCKRCGDGVAHESEVCDGADLRGKTCASLLVSPTLWGTLACKADCSNYDDSGCFNCTTCGDCNYLACINGRCQYCRNDSDCCAPLECLGGVCALY